jgi:hypothetical protein
MATGDQADFLGRLKAVLPLDWFPDATPVLDGLLSGPANALAWCYSLLAFVKAQARRLTASGITLDLISADFFGSALLRQTNESDATFSARIGRELFRQKGTRPGLIQALVDLTGRTPAVFEPAYTNDTGGYGSAGMTVGSGLGYGVAGGYGDLQLPFQFFLTAYRPTGGGIASVAGYGNIATSVTGMPGGYGAGALEYASLDMIEGEVTDADILGVINDVRPAASIAWTRISS